MRTGLLGVLFAGILRLHVSGFDARHAIGALRIARAHKVHLTGYLTLARGCIDSWFIQLLVFVYVLALVDFLESVDCLTQVLIFFLKLLQMLLKLAVKFFAF